MTGRLASASDQQHHQGKGRLHGRPVFSTADSRSGSAAPIKGNVRKLAKGADSQESIESRIGEMERKLDRLRGLYESFFMGIERAPPNVARHEMNRLMLERDRARYPGIAHERIRRPLVITGLPRSGSTFLHGLLAQDPASRVPLHWELRFPSPPERSTRDTDPRIERVARQIRWFFRVAPEFQKIHPVGAQLPEECVVILSHAFLSFEFSSNWFVPSYQSWLEQHDLEPAYRYHRRFLQQLQWADARERWLLKAPPHLPGLRALWPSCCCDGEDEAQRYRRSSCDTPRSGVKYRQQKGGSLGAHHASLTATGHDGHD